MKAREEILTVVCLVLVFFAVQALALGPLAVLAESESVLPLGFEGNTNTFYGTWAGYSTTGDNDYDTFIGSQAGFSNTTGQFNTFLGWVAGHSNTTGGSNTFLASYAGYSNTTGFANTIVGEEAGYANTTGGYNSFIGYQAGYHNTTGNHNSFVGSAAGYSNTTGYSNAFLGYDAGRFNTTGNSNSFIGYQAGNSNTTGGGNSFLGLGSGYSNTTGGYNTFTGLEAGRSNTTGFSNTFIGSEAGYSNTEGFANTYVGRHAGGSSTGSGNTLVGNETGFYNTAGWRNTMIGEFAGRYNTGGSNVFIGWSAGENDLVSSNRLFIDNTNTKDPLIYGEFDNRRLTVNGNLEVIGPENGLVRLSNVTTNNTVKGSRMVLNHYSNAQLPVYLFGAASTATDNFVAFGGGNPIGNAATQIDLFTAANTTTPTGTARITVKSNGYVGIGTQSPAAPLQMAGGAYTNGTQWINASSREYKEDIESLTSQEALEAIRDLNPVKFAYKADRTARHVGFIAEEVPGLVATKDRKGLSPMDIVAVLTKVVQELKAENEAMKQRLLTLEGKVGAGR